MNDNTISNRRPLHYDDLLEQAQLRGFTMASDMHLGSLLRTLVASKPKGRFLELGTGAGLSLCWMVDGMDNDSELISLDNDMDLVALVEPCFKNNNNVHIYCTDAGDWINSFKGPKFDLIFADTWPGKYSHLEATLRLLKKGGFYVVDDMTEQPNWPQGHFQKAENLMGYLERHKDFDFTKIAWSTGIMLGTKRR